MPLAELPARASAGVANLRVRRPGSSLIAAELVGAGEDVLQPFRSRCRRR